MPVANANGIELCYESIGDDRDEPMILIMGLGVQLLGWDRDFCAALAARGFRVIRFDNRDTGLSTKLDHLPVPRVRSMMVRSTLGLPVSSPYSLSDMAADAVGLMDALGIEQGHVVGASMGGMIAQIVAIEHPDRVRSLTSIMSHPGDRLSRIPRPVAARALLGPAPRSREEAVERNFAIFKVIGSPGFPLNEARRRRYAEQSYERSFYPRGFVRQMAAITAAPSRRRALRTVRAPTMVIHGSHDPLILPRGGRVTAGAIPGAQLNIIPGMGHELPEGAWSTILDSISHIAARAS